MITQSDINDGRCYWYAAFKRGNAAITMVNRHGIPIKGVDLAPDGKTIVQKKKRYDVSTELKRKRSPKQKFAKAVK